MRRNIKQVLVSKLASFSSVFLPNSRDFVWGFFSLFVRVLSIFSCALLLSNCSTSSKVKKGYSSTEVGAFSDSKYGKASQRVVEVDENAPKGGGRYQVGKPYSVAGKTYVPKENPAGYSAVGKASWYGIAFHGRKTANGEIYDRNSISAAHPTLPLPSYVKVTNLANNYSMVVRVNDRGPYHQGRVMDLSEKAASMLDFKSVGTAKVKIDYLGPASLAGSDDVRLASSLSANGTTGGYFGKEIKVASISNNISDLYGRNAPSIRPVIGSSDGEQSFPSEQASSSVEQSVVVDRDVLNNTGGFTKKDELIFEKTENKKLELNPQHPAAYGVPVPPARPFSLRIAGGVHNLANMRADASSLIH